MLLTMHNADDPDTSSPMKLLGKWRESAQQYCASTRTTIARTADDIITMPTMRRMMRLWIIWARRWTSCFQSMSMWNGNDLWREQNALLENGNSVHQVWKNESEFSYLWRRSSHLNTSFQYWEYYSGAHSTGLVCYSLSTMACLTWGEFGVLVLNFWHPVVSYVELCGMWFTVEYAVLTIRCRSKYEKKYRYVQQHTPEFLNSYE